MKTFKPLRNQKGLTLIEVMTALVLFGMITTILYSFLFMGISMYKRVAAEAQLRSQVNVFYGQLLGFFEQSVYAYQGSRENEIIVIKKEIVDAAQTTDTNYIRYYSVLLNPDEERIELKPVTGNGMLDNDSPNAVVQSLDKSQFDIQNTSKLLVRSVTDRQFVSIDLVFSSKKRGNAEKEQPTIRIKTEIPIAQ
jgi:prepilin-type N-terminal cleavage/methylation domain-containing protein